MDRLSRGLKSLPSHYEALLVIDRKDFLFED